MTTIVTPWRGRRDLERDYWAAVRMVDAKVLIIDDGSEPPLPNAVRIEPSGFSHACNVGLELVDTDTVVFINNDVIGAGDWLSPLMETLEPGVLAGAEIVSPPHAQVDGVALPYIDGWCLAGYTDDLLELGGWDESLEEPSYYGDNLLCLEARAAGFILRESRETARLLHHKRNQTAGPGSDPRVRRASEINRGIYQTRARDLMAVAA